MLLFILQGRSHALGYMSTFTRKMGDLVMHMFKTHKKCACKFEILANAPKTYLAFESLQLSVYIPVSDVWFQCPLFCHCHIT